MSMTVSPPSALPGISPSRAEIDSRHGLPHFSKTGARRNAINRLASGLGEGTGAALHPISPLEGQMVGRPEGGVTVSVRGEQQ
jgi:hypothetical protein